jgi:hypothetical protein
LLDYLRWGGQKKPIPLVSKDRDIGRECGIVGCPRRGLKDGLECHTRIFHKHAKKGFAVFQAAEIAGMPDEEAGCLPKSLESIMRCMMG